MTDGPRYPGYDVLAKRDTPSWDEVTRDGHRPPAGGAARAALLHRRRVADAGRAVRPHPAAAADRPPMPLPAYVDAKLTENHLDGYRYATLPPQGEAWQRGLAALDAEAQGAHGAGFHALTPTSRTRCSAACRRAS